MCETLNIVDDLGNIELLDETQNDLKKEIVLIECSDNEIDQSIFGILTLPENMD